jgi:hypothetical protein
MIIWEGKNSKSFFLIDFQEYRLHAIVFTARGCLVFLFSLYRPFYGHWLENFLLYGIFSGCHLVVDEITRRYGSREHTTVRIDGDTSVIATMILRFYSFYQISAIGCLITPTDRLGDMGFNTFIAIQSSAFLMTLFRKNLIPWWIHGLVYSLCLWLSLYHMAMAVPGIIFLKVLVVFLLRTQLRVGKYWVWGLFALSNLPIFDSLLGRIKHVLL